MNEDVKLIRDLKKKHTLSNNSLARLLGNSSRSLITNVECGRIRLSDKSRQIAQKLLVTEKLGSFVYLDWIQ